MLDTIIDLSHHNSVSDLSALKAAGVQGIIHKATQGAGYSDPQYAPRRQAITAAGMLFGAYHFGTGGDAEGQAEHFVAVAGKEPLLVLDFEDNPQGQTMTLAEAEQFVQQVRQLTGRYPGLYSGHTLAEALAAAGISKPSETALSNCWLWQARYGKEPTPPAPWSAWTLWQYTDGVVNTSTPPLPGVGPCDRDRFNGTAEELERFWTENSG